MVYSGMTNTFPTRENPHTNPNLTPAQRAHQALNCVFSCDWNPKTEEFNPYPVGSTDFREYERTLEGLTAYGRDNGYDF
jgi:hypothetical protein